MTTRFKLIPLNFPVEWLQEQGTRKNTKTLQKGYSTFITVLLSLCPHSGLIDGYTGERAALEEQLRQKEELQLNLEQELQVRHVRCRKEAR